jgi:hypothetical protein
MNAPWSKRWPHITEGFSLAKEGESNRKGEVATVCASERSQLCERFSMATEPDSTATSYETSINATEMMG